MKISPASERSGPNELLVKLQKKGVGKSVVFGREGLWGLCEPVPRQFGALLHLGYSMAAWSKP